MRIHLIRAAMALAVMLAVSGTAVAQSMVRGVVVDENEQPIEGATVTIEPSEGMRRFEVTTNDRGEYMQVGVQSGEYTITAEWEGRIQQYIDNVSGGQPLLVDFVLAPVEGLTEEQSQNVTALADGGIAALTEGRNAEAIEMFDQLIAAVPECADCYFNLGVAHSNLQQWDEAVQAFQSSLELVPDNASAYSALAGVYNAQQEFELAAEAGAKAAELGGGAGDPAVFYNQGVILWNSGDYAGAKAQFESAIAADPTLGMAYFQLGMANVNLGMVPEAREAFEGYLEAEPNGDRAAEVTGFLEQLPQ